MDKFQNKKANQLMGLSAEKWMEELWGVLLDKLSKAKSKKEFQELLEKLISHSEKKMILRRLATLALVRSGKSYSEISKTLWISPATISTIKKNIFGNSESYKSYRDFYKGKTKRSSFNEQGEKTYTDGFSDLISLAGVIFEPFSKKGLGITGHRNLEWPRKK